MSGNPIHPNGAEVPGLQVRVEAATALQYVLNGNNFIPIGAEIFADSRDRALANRLVTTALRRQGHINEILAATLTKGMPKRSGTFEAVLRIGLTELLFVPDQAAHSALFLSVEALRTNGRAKRFDKLLNGVLRQAQRDAERWQNLKKNLLVPVWLRADWTERFGKENVEKFADALLAGAPLDITLKDRDGGRDEELAARLGGVWLCQDSIRVSSRDKSVADMANYADGRWWVQDAAAAIPARLFDKLAGASAVDLCAAPGGKTAQLCKAGYDVTGFDRSPRRLATVEQNLARLGYQATLVEQDVLEIDQAQKFEMVLLDAPCTATGTFRRHPEVLWHREMDDVREKSKLQRKMLRKAVELLVPGGELIYCVCSMQAEEGEVQADWVLHKFPQLDLVPITDSACDGLEWISGTQGWMRTHPGLGWRDATPGGLDGFFIAHFRRTG